MKFNEEVFDSFQILQTERLILREITLEDLNEIYAVYSDSEAMKYFGRNPYADISEAEEMVAIVINGFQKKEGVRWGITLKNSDGKLIGTAGIWRLLKTHLRGEVGYELSTEYWRKGIMSEALSEIIKFGFNNMNLHSIEANLDPDNIASVKLLEKLGFIKEGHTRESYCLNDRFTDTGIYSLLRC